MLMNDVFDKLNNCLNDGYSKLRSMRGADPNGFNYAMLENSLSVIEDSYTSCLNANFDQRLLNGIELECREKGQPPFSAIFLQKLMNTYLLNRYMRKAILSISLLIVWQSSVCRNC